MDKKSIYCNKPELWGGIECSINRVRDRFKDQLEDSGHYNRDGDIEAFAQLGIRTLRYPILWERHQPVRNKKIDWGWTARQLGKIRASGIQTIAGLVHHGSGPRYTDLLDPDFPYLLGEYAYQVANQFPEINAYTPVNEPLTTARFSGLYGTWYPHHKADASFARILINQLKGTTLAMQAIRFVNPTAQLIQTEDLGKTHSTPSLAYQADFENNRRWLTFDILCGHFLPDHPLWDYFICSGIREKDLYFFLENPCCPDLLGLNHYVTSERWLDESLDKYPLNTHGSNGQHRYADTEIVRANPGARSGFKSLATETWLRYRLPLAATEVHLHCTREEQMRWFTEIWDASVDLSSVGIPVKGVTAWSLLGAYDWDSLLIQDDGHYEPGIFDVRAKAERPRKTAMAGLISGLARGDGARHPLLQARGWWHGFQPTSNFLNLTQLLLIGEDDCLRAAFTAVCNQRGIPHICRNPESGRSGLPAVWAILHLEKDLTANQLTIFSGALTLITSASSPLTKFVHQALDLIIDCETGIWTLPDAGTLQPARPEIASKNTIRQENNTAYIPFSIYGGQ